MNKLSFSQRVYRITCLIPRGQVASYSDIARALGNRGLARAVGNALNKNPYAPQVPCHRVVRANGEVGGFASGTKNKINILKKEGILIRAGNIDLNKYGYQFKK